MGMGRETERDTKREIETGIGIETKTETRREAGRFRAIPMGRLIVRVIR